MMAEASPLLSVLQAVLPKHDKGTKISKRRSALFENEKNQFDGSQHHMNVSIIFHSTFLSCLKQRKKKVYSLWPHNGGLGFLTVVTKETARLNVPSK
jgi:hypothetical protein